MAAHLLRSWVRITPGAWIFVCCECRVLSGRGLCDELITRPEESYRLCCVVVCDLETSRIGAPYIYIYMTLVTEGLIYVVRHKKDETKPIAREPRIGGKRQTVGYRTCSHQSQCYKAQLDRFTQYKWTRLKSRPALTLGRKMSDWKSEQRFIIRFLVKL